MRRCNSRGSTLRTPAFYFQVPSASASPEEKKGLNAEDRFNDCDMLISLESQDGSQCR
jgi:hypothetical protein